MGHRIYFPVIGAQRECIFQLFENREVWIQIIRAQVVIGIQIIGHKGRGGYRLLGTMGIQIIGAHKSDGVEIIGGERAQIIRKTEQWKIKSFNDER